MSIELDQISEVQTVNAPIANQFLNNGYVLLGIFPITTQREDRETKNSYTQHGVTFIVGRDDSVKPFSVQRRNEQPIANAPV